MAVKPPTATRAPNGTKALVRAFFATANEVPAARRNAVIEAALSAIHDKLKGNAATAKAVKPTKAATIRQTKPLARRSGKTAAAAVKAKQPRKSATKSTSAPKVAEPAARRP